MKFIKIQTNWVNWVKRWSHRLKKLEEGINDTANTKGNPNVQTWTTLKRIAIVVFKNLLLAEQFFKVHFC